MSNAYMTQAGATQKIKKIYDVKDGLTRKLKKGYVVENGLTKKIFSSDPVVYTGNFTVTDVEVSGAPYLLYTLTSSGTLTLLKDAQYWICGGGADGTPASTYGGEANSSNGGGGGGGYAKQGSISLGTFSVTIAAKGGTTKILDTETNASYSASGGNSTAGTSTPYDGGSGGSGGGSGGSPSSGNAAKGDGGSKYPFGIASLYAHCAGGGGGSYAYFNTDGTSIVIAYIGGAGGSNGANGGLRTSGSGVRASGGDRGGGSGGSSSSRNGNKATFYGSGGGGGASTYSNKTSTYTGGSAGAGYQGVVYLLIPAA